jgi:hypothetical protein
MTSHTEIADSFSVQLNSNDFSTPYGNTGWLQFVDQKIPGQNDLLCVWKFDLTVFYASKDGKEGYESSCVALPVVPGRSFLGATAIRDVVSHAHVEGLVRTGLAGKNLITFWGATSWDFPLLKYKAITVPDTVQGITRGLAGDISKYDFGFAGQWTQVTGDIYGTGYGSRADFTGTRISERLTASTCEPDAPLSQPSCGVGAPTQFSLSRYATPVDDPRVTCESNNLLRDSDFLNLSGPSSWSTFKCISPDTCKWWGNFRSRN